MKTLLYIGIILLAFSFSSCEKYAEEILPVVGVYNANIQGVGGPFSISISVVRGDEIQIDAPWDGENWYLIDAEILNDFDFEKRIRIYDQRIDDDTRIWGDGVFFDYSIQLDYTIRQNGVRRDYTLVGTKL